MTNSAPCQRHPQLTKQFALQELLIQEGADLASLLACVVFFLGLLGTLLVKDLLLLRALRYQI